MDRIEQRRRFRAERLRSVALLRLLVVPLSLLASVAADGPAATDPVFLAVAAAGFAYAATLWEAARRGRGTNRAIGVADVVVLLAVVLAANPRVDPAGRMATLAYLAGWALVATPRAVIGRGLALGAAVTVLQLVVRGGSPNPHFVAGGVLGIILAALVAAELRRRDAREEELELRSRELLAEADDLERRERERIAQLVHDDALQRLLAARQDLEPGIAGDADALEHALRGLGEATDALRGLTRVVHDDVLEAAGLEAAIRRLVDDAARRADLEATLAIDHDICGAANATVIAVVRELTANVVRHAQASHLEVEVRRRPEAVAIVVRDDGRGILLQDLVDAALDGHLGHAALRRRVEQLHGTLTVDARPGTGTRVEVVLADADLRAGAALESSLRRERHWNAALVAGFPHPFVVVSEELRLVEVSDRFVELTGFTRGELLAAPAGDLPYWPPEHRERIRAFASAVQDGVDREATLQIARKDGFVLDVVVTATAVVDPRGGRRLQLVTFRDVTVAARTDLTPSARHPGAVVPGAPDP